MTCNTCTKNIICDNQKIKFYLINTVIITTIFVIINWLNSKKILIIYKQLIKIITTLCDKL